VDGNGLHIATAGEIGSEYRRFSSVPHSSFNNRHLSGLCFK